MLNARPSLPAAPLLTPAELRAALQLSPREYSRQLQQGLPVAFAAGRAKRFRLDEVLAWSRLRQTQARPATDLVAVLQAEARRQRPLHLVVGGRRR